MIFGTTVGSTQPIPIENNRLLSNILIVGKSSISILQNYFIDAIHRGEGGAYIGNPTDILPHIPSKRTTILIEPHWDYPRSFNVLEKASEKQRSAIADYVLDAFAAAYPANIPTPRLDKNLRAAVLAMLSISDGSLYAAYHLFTSKTYRAQVIKRLKDPDLKKRWELFHSLPEKDQRLDADSIISRLDPLITDPSYRNIFAQTKCFKIRPTDVVLVKVPKGRSGSLLAALVMTHLTGKVYIEKPHVFVGAGQAIMACQYLDQLPEDLRQEMLGTATLVCSRIATKDMKLLAPEFDLPNQPLYGDLNEVASDLAYVKQDETVLVRVPKNDFPIYPAAEAKVRTLSQSDNYSASRVLVEQKIADFIARLT